jgi:hypothetical protein
MSSAADEWSLGVPAPTGDVRCPKCAAAVPPAPPGYHRCGCGARETVAGPAVSYAELVELRRKLEWAEAENARLRALLDAVLIAYDADDKEALAVKAPREYLQIFTNTIPLQRFR